MADAGCDAVAGMLQLSGGRRAALLRWHQAAAAGGVPDAAPLQPARGSRRRPEVHLFIGVPSVSAERRAAIRASWGRLAAGEHGVALRFFTHRDEGAHPDEPEAESSKNPAQTPLCGDVVFMGDELLSGESLLPGQNGVTQKVTLPY